MVAEATVDEGGGHEVRGRVEVGGATAPVKAAADRSGDAEVDESPVGPLGVSTDDACCPSRAAVVDTEELSHTQSSEGVEDRAVTASCGPYVYRIER